jgi:hypothetical protein
MNKKETPLYGIIDERTTDVVYKGDAYAGRFMMFAVLIDVFLRGLILSNPVIDGNWDLILIVIAGGFISIAYQMKNKVVFNRPLSRSLLFLACIVGISALIAVIFNFLI